MNASIARFWFVILPLLLSACASQHDPDNPYEPFTQQAINALAELKVAGQLPGVTKGTKGELQSGSLPIGDKVVYPVPLELRLTTTPGNAQFGYVFVKKNKKAGWVLVRAWRFLPDGKVEDLTIPAPVTAH